MHTETRDRRPHATELKFQVSPDAGAAIRAWARIHLTADPHGAGPHGDAYSITTLYTDTPDQDVYRRRGSYGRSKYRVRRYGVSDIVFLERKLRTRSLLSKRRSTVPLTEVAHLEDEVGELGDWPGLWFASRLTARRLHPVCQVTYGRTARVTSTPYGLARLTVDAQLSAQVATGWSFSTPDYTPVLTDQHIVELKFLVAMPAIFKRFVETFGLAPMTVSKYRLSIAGLGLAPATASTAAEVA